MAPRYVYKMGVFKSTLMNNFAHVNVQFLNNFAYNVSVQISEAYCLWLKLQF